MSEASATTQTTRRRTKLRWILTGIAAGILITLGSAYRLGYEKWQKEYPEGQTFTAWIARQFAYVANGFSRPPEPTKPETVPQPPKPPAGDVAANTAPLNSAEVKPGERATVPPINPGSPPVVPGANPAATTPPRPQPGGLVPDRSDPSQP